MNISVFHTQSCSSVQKHTRRQQMVIAIAEFSLAKSAKHQNVTIQIKLRVAKQRMNKAAT